MLSVTRQSYRPPPRDQAHVAQNSRRTMERMNTTTRKIHPGLIRVLRFRGAGGAGDGRAPRGRRSCGGAGGGGASGRGGGEDRGPSGVRSRAFSTASRARWRASSTTSLIACLPSAARSSTARRPSATASPSDSATSSRERSRRSDGSSARRDTSSDSSASRAARSISSLADSFLPDRRSPRSVTSAPAPLWIRLPARRCRIPADPVVGSSRAGSGPGWARGVVALTSPDHGAQ